MKLIVILIALISLVGCSLETVPPAHKGKILSPSGYSSEVIPPGKLTTWFRDELILLETPVRTVEEPQGVLMKDKLRLEFDVRARVEIRDDANVINSMFDKVSPEGNRVTFDMVYSTYAKPAIRNKSREVLSGYTVEDVIQNYERISSEIYIAVSKALEGTPVVVQDLALGSMNFPAVVTAAVENAKKRELEIAQEQAQVEIEMTKKEGERRLANADYEVRIIKAKAIRDENKIIGEGVTDDLLKLRSLEVQEKMAENGSAVFMPYEAFSNTGAQVRMFGKP